MVNSGPTDTSHAIHRTESQEIPRNSPRKDPMLNQVWQDRHRFLPRLQLRAQSVIRLVLDGLVSTDKEDFLIPEDIESWLRQIRFEGDENAYSDTIELLRSPLLLSPHKSNENLMSDVAENFTRHKYIRIQEYEEKVRLFVEDDFPEEKVYKILYLANLSILLVEIIEMTAEWENMSPEQRRLAISEIDLVFPMPFVYPGELGPTNTMQIISELRTQIFIQMYLEMQDAGDLDEWNSQEKVTNIFKMDEEHETVRPEERKVKPLPEKQVLIAASKYVPAIRAIQSHECNTIPKTDVMVVAK